MPLLFKEIVRFEKAQCYIHLRLVIGQLEYFLDSLNILFAKRISRSVWLSAMKTRVSWNVIDEDEDAEQ